MGTQHDCYASAVCPPLLFVIVHTLFQFLIIKLGFFVRRIRDRCKHLRIHDQLSWIRSSSGVYAHAYTYA